VEPFPDRIISSSLQASSPMYAQPYNHLVQFKSNHLFQSPSDGLVRQLFAGIFLRGNGIKWSAVWAEALSEVEEAAKDQKLIS